MAPWHVDVAGLAPKKQRRKLQRKKPQRKRQRKRDELNEIFEEGR